MERLAEEAKIQKAQLAEAQSRAREHAANFDHERRRAVDAERESDWYKRKHDSAKYDLEAVKSKLADTERHWQSEKALAREVARDADNLGKELTKLKKEREQLTKNIAEVNATLKARQERIRTIETRSYDVVRNNVRLNRALKAKNGKLYAQVVEPEARTAPKTSDESGAHASKSGNGDGREDALRKGANRLKSVASRAYNWIATSVTVVVALMFAVLMFDVVQPDTLKHAFAWVGTIKGEGAAQPRSEKLVAAERQLAEMRAEVRRLQDELKEVHASLAAGGKEHGSLLPHYVQI